MNKHHYKSFDIEVFDDSDHRFGAVDNKFSYSKYYFGESSGAFPVSRHGIKICKSGKEVNDGIIIGFSGATTIHKNSSIIDGNLLLICCSDTLFCLTIPELELKWKVPVDQTTCIQIFKLEKDYLIHGESQITRIDKDGKVKWRFVGEDIFVSNNHEQEIKIASDCIFASDYHDIIYKLDYNGKLLSRSNKLTEKH